MPLPQLQTYPGIETPRPADAMMKGQQMQRGQMENALMGKKLGDYDEDRAYLKKSRGKEDEEYRYKKLQRHVAKAREFLPQVNSDNYDDYLAWNEEGGISKDMFKSVEEFRAMTPEQREEYKLQLAQKADDLVAKDLATLKAENKSHTLIQLTQDALAGDTSAQMVLDKIQKDKVAVSAAGAQAGLDAKLGVIDVEGTARAILDGRLLMEDVKNTFGVAVQERVRKEVLKENPKFDFIAPRTAYKALASSLRNQEKQRGMMGSFVGNLNKQLKRVDEIGSELTRVDPRIINIPIRAWKTKIAGSGHEKAFEAYLLEISNEIAKLSTGSQASIRELSTDAQDRWAKIHDPNLSLPDLKIILAETKQMANMRLDSTDDEIRFTKSKLRNIMGETPSQGTQTTTQKTVIESRTAPDGRTINKYSDGTIGYE